MGPTLPESHKWIEVAAQGIEDFAVVVMIAFIVVGTGLSLYRFAKKVPGVYSDYRAVLARSLQIGLELLVAADIVRTVSTPLTVPNILLLGGVVLVRTFLGWSLNVKS